MRLDWMKVMEKVKQTQTPTFHSNLKEKDYKQKRKMQLRDGGVWVSSNKNAAFD